jgi:hypothetical protein
VRQGTKHLWQNAHHSNTPNFGNQLPWIALIAMIALISCPVPLLPRVFNTPTCGTARIEVPKQSNMHRKWPVASETAENIDLN